MSDLEERARAWIADDPDPSTRAELERLLADRSAEAKAELEDRFARRLHFGTAGLRGAVAAGPNRMNRAVVRTATAALAAWLDEHVPASRQAGVVVGCDARHGSAEFDEEVALVLTGAGFHVHLLPAQRPTPLLAFAVPHLSAVGGVMITASHNPPADNGYKLYLDDGAQIVPPADAEIEAAIDRIGPLAAIALGETDSPLVVHHGADVLDAYLDALAAESPAPPHAPPLKVVYTPLHGVALGVFLAALERAGWPAPHVVPAQAAPDADFPTVAFPNPEEPGALDLALDEARAIDADLVIANDPDGDRLAVAVPDPARRGGWRVLTGDQLGSLLGEYLLGRGTNAGGSRLVATTIVSSSMLSKIAAAAGVSYAETLTGFKWIVRAARTSGPEPADATTTPRFVLGYEEALGYCVGEVVRDKDGIGAALAVLAMAAESTTTGRSLLDRWDALEIRYGVHLTAQLSIRHDSPTALMTRLRDAPLHELAGMLVTDTLDLAGGLGHLPASDVLIYRMGGARLVVRPSGTEPKLKAYLEVVAPLGAAGLEHTRRLAAETLDQLRDAVVGALSA
ncbi:MAG: phospho-sugar mutase [Acidimicrobiales bacterium]